MADYKLTEDGVFHHETGMSIPDAVGNRHWQEYLTYAADGGLTDPLQSPEEALSEVLGGIDVKNSESNKELFSYDGHQYDADVDSIQATAVELTGMLGTASIPVPNGQWKTAEKEVDGQTPIYVAFTCTEFRAFKTAFYQRGADNFGIKEGHKTAVRQMFLDGDDGDTISLYDYSTGWL